MTQEEALAKIRAGSGAITICRHVAGQPLRIDFQRGYFCKICGAELQLSANAQAQVAAGAIPLCGECGVSMAERLKAAGKEVDVSVSPDARAAIERGQTLIDPARVARLEDKDG